MHFITLASLLVVLVASYASSAAQISSPLARELTSHNGLTQTIVTSMAEDPRGRFWIGTQDGVNVIDGNSIKLLSSLKSKNALTGKVVVDLVSDHKDAVWVATTQGLNKVSSRDFSVENILYQNQPMLDIRSMLLLDAEHLAIVANQSLHLLHLETGQFQEKPGFSHQILQMGEAEDGLLLQTSSGYFHYQKGQKPTKISVPPELQIKGANFLFADQKLWAITTDQQVVSCTTAGCQPFALPALDYAAMQNLQIKLHQDQLYFVTNGQIILYSLKTRAFRQIKPQLPANRYTSPQNNAVIHILQSKDIAISRRQGLMIVPDRYQNISSYPQFSPLAGNEIYNLTAIKGATAGDDQLLIASDNRLELYQFIQQSPQLIQQIKYPKPMTPALLLHFQQQVLLSTIDAGVFVLDLHKGQLTPWLAELPEVSRAGTLIDVIELDDDHQLLLFHKQLLMLQQQAQGPVILWTAPLPTSKTAKMIYHNNHLVIAAYQQGLLSSPWPDKTKAPANWQVNASGNPVLDIRATSGGELQLMTAEQGVQLLQPGPDGIKTQTLSVAPGLRNTTAVCSVELSDSVWVAATHDGLSLYNKNNELLRHLTLYDGLVQKEFNQYQCGKINGEAYFSGEQGLTLIGPSETQTEQKTQLQLTHLLVDGQHTSLEQGALTLTEPNTIILDYSYAPYPILAPVRFQFKLEPGNNEWFETNATTLRYTQLSPDQYRLHLKALRFDGSVSDTVHLDFQIKPVFWRSPQAYAFYSLTFVFILWFYFRQRWQIQQAKLQVAESQRKFQTEYTDKLEEAVRLRTTKLEQQQQEFLLLQQEKIAFLTTTSHDLKNLSALIQLNLADLNKYLLPTGQSSWHNVHSSCKLLNTLVDDILELSKLNAGVITPNLQPVDLPQLLQQVYQPFKLMAAERQIDLHLNIHDELLVLTDPYLLSRLLMNLLDNALKNLSAGHSVQLELKKRYRTSRQVYLLVRDSGPGLPEHMRRHWGLAFQRGASGYQGSGLGLSIVKKIAELLVLPVSLYSSERGTCFELRLQQTEATEANAVKTCGYAAIIESDPQARQFLYYELVRRGLQVTVFNNAKDFARSGQRGFGVLISDIHFNATDDTLADLALLKSSLEADGKLIFVSSDASVRHRLPDHPQLYFMLKPVKRSRLAWLLAKET